MRARRLAALLPMMATDEGHSTAPIVQVFQRVILIHRGIRPCGLLRQGFLVLSLLDTGILSRFGGTS
jgi:hypothetical protein